MIAYKAVTPDRKSVIVELYSKYCLNYKKGKTVIAPDNTLGIMCFKTKQEVENFIEAFTLHTQRWIIIKVDSGKEKSSHPKSISNNTSEYILDDFYNHSPMYNQMEPWKDTICFKQIKVLT